MPAAAVEFPKFEMPKFDMPKFELPRFDMPKFAAVDTETMMAAHRRNLEAFASAGQILADGFKTVGQRQAEIFQARMSEMSTRVETVMKVKDKADLDVAGQIDGMKSAYTKAVADAKELTNILWKAQTDAMDVMSQCVLANLDDMKKLAA